MAENQTPSEEGKLPEILLSPPQSEVQQQYLGITDEKTSFTIPQIKATVVIIEIFSMYCPHCQREAPAINELYQRIQAHDTLKNKVRLIGIGVGNSDFEVSMFQKTYHIPFPLFSDGDFSIHKKLGEVRTPYFIGVKINKDGTHQVFYSKLGAIQDKEAFLKILTEQID
jgi:peroxiredoxin